VHAQSPFTNSLHTALNSLTNSIDSLQQSVQTRSMTLRVLTYNINALPWDDETGKHERYAQIGVLLDKLRQEDKAPHIITIQEAFHPRSAELIEESNYPYFRLGAPANSDAPLNSGLIILSEFPIESASSIDYEICMGWDCWANKGVLHVRVRVPGLPVPIEIYNTHMNANSGNDPVEAGKIREQQIAQLHEFIGFTRPAGTPAFFAADFNFKPERPEYDVFAAYPGIANAAEFCMSGKCSGTDAPEGVWRKYVDHQFFLPGLTPAIRIVPIHVEQTFDELVGGKPLSDHLGLETHYRLSWQPASPNS